MNEKQKIILPEDPEAATFRTDVSGWVTRTGFFCGKNEELARLEGSTHKKCACGAVYPKCGWSICPSCLKQRDIERYNAMPKKPWDGETMIYSMLADRYFSEIEEIEEYAEDTDTFIPELQLVICEPVFARPIEEDYFESELPEDCSVRDLDPDLDDLIAAVNEHIKAQKTPLSWKPGKFAVDLSA